MGEPEWRAIPGYEGLYEVSDFGSVRSLFRYKKQLKPSKQSNGYLSVDLFKEKRRKHCLIHRLVAMAFIPNPENLPQINHKDENRTNNTVENLEWCSAKYNMNYGVGGKTRHSKIDYSKPCFAENARKNGAKRSKRGCINHTFLIVAMENNEKPLAVSCGDLMKGMMTYRSCSFGIR